MKRRTLILGAGALGAGSLLGPLAAQPASAGPRPARGGPAAELTRLFAGYGDTGGAWTGADGAYSVPVHGRTAWIFSDTFLGTVNPDGSRPRSSPFIHNCLVVQQRGRLGPTLHGGEAPNPASLFTVAGGDELKTWYWSADATLEGQWLRILLLRFDKTGDDVFDFAFRGTAIGSVHVRTGRVLAARPRPGGRIHWGSGILEEGRDTYVYGVDDQGARKFLHLARVPRGRIGEAAAWRYFADGRWSPSEADSSPLLEGAANELSVRRRGSGYLLVTSDATQPLSADIVCYSARRPWGDFTRKVRLFQTPETGGNVFTYNAKEHPQYARGRHSVISYNVNSFDTDDVYADVENYRPRFIDVRLP